MTALIIIGIILLVLLLLVLLPASVRLEYSGSGFVLLLNLGFVRIKLPKTDSGDKKKSRKPEKKKEQQKEKGGSVAKLKELLPVVTEALGRLRRKLSINHLYIHYIAAGDDPAKAAMEYGAGNALVGIILPVLENNFNVRRRDIKVDVDFEEEKSTIYADVKLRLMLWQIVYIAAAFLPYFKTKTNNKEKEVQQ